MVAHHAEQSSSFVPGHSTATGKPRQTCISKQFSTENRNSYYYNCPELRIVKCHTESEKYDTVLSVDKTTMPQFTS